jgi:hypothetical protein
LDGDGTITHANQLLANNYIVLANQPGRGKKGVGFIHILRLRREPLQDISEEDAMAEGMIIEILKEALAGLYPHRCSFFRLWDRIHVKTGERVVDNPMVIVHEFEVVND